MISDLKFALRTLARAPLFTAVAVLSLALGIGANTAIFSLLDQLLLRLLPVERPEELVMIWSRGAHSGNNRGDRRLSYPMYQDFQQKAEALSEVFARFQTAVSMSHNGETERIQGELVSGNFFSALGVKPAIGRVLSSKEDDTTYKGHPVAVLSHDYWVSRFNADPNIIGQKILVNNYPMTVVGVSAAGFHGLDPARAVHIRIPLQMKPVMTPDWDDLGNRRSRWVQVFGRMKPGHTPESVRASLQPLFTQILQEEVKMAAFNNSTKYQRERFLKMEVRTEQAATGYSQTRNSSGTALIVLMCMVGLVLLIACANVANLLIARSVARQKEIAVRLSIGASRGQLVRQLLIESVLLSMAGGVLAIFIAMSVTRALIATIPAGSAPLLLKATPDLRVMSFNMALALVTGILFGLIPALKSTRLDLWSTLKDAVGSIAGGTSVGLRKGLVMAQVALSFLLLAGAGLFIKSLQNLQDTNTGFRDIDNLVVFQVDPTLNGYDASKLRGFYKRMMEQLRSTPGVKSAGTAAVELLAGNEWDSTMGVEGHQPKDGEDMQAFMNMVTPGYFATMGVPVLEGRDFSGADETAVVIPPPPDSFHHAIVNRKFASHFFGDKSAIGRHIGFGINPGAKLNIEIIGVVEDSLYEGPREGVRRQVFLCQWQSSFAGGVAVYVRTNLDSAQMHGALRAAIKQLDPTLPIYGMTTLQSQLDQTLVTERLVAVLSAAFGALATLLAAIGLYGVMAFVVARRTKEIGVRIALGADAGSVIWLVMREVLVLLGVGLAVGIPAAYGLSRFVSSQLFAIQAADPWVAATAAVVLSSVAVLAGYVPAQRASRVDPMMALRYE